VPIFILESWKCWWMFRDFFKSFWIDERKTDSHVCIDETPNCNWSVKANYKYDESRYALVSNKSGQLRNTRTKQWLFDDDGAEDKTLHLRSPTIWRHPSCGWLLFSCSRVRNERCVHSCRYADPSSVVSSELNVLVMIYRQNVTRSIWDDAGRKHEPCSRWRMPGVSSLMLRLTCLLFQAKVADT